MFIPKNEGSNYTPPPAGTHVAICYRVIDLGTQDGEWKGKPKRQHKIMVSWELPDELMEDGRPFTISQRYTFSSSEKAKFRHDLESWRGVPFKDSDFGPGGFHVGKLLRAPCMLTIVHEEKGGKVYANIKGVAKMLKGVPVPPLTNPEVFFSLSEFNPAVFESLPDRLQEIIRQSPEYAEATGAASSSAPDEKPNGDDDIPF